MKRGPLIALTLAVLLPAAAYFLLASAPGSAWLLGMGSRIGGERFDFRSVDGSFASGLRFSGLRIHLMGHRLEARELGFRWRPGALLGGRLHLEQVRVSGADYTPPDAEPEAPPAKPGIPAVTIPVAVRVDDVRIEDVRIRGGGAVSRVDRGIVEDLDIDGRILRLARLEVTADRLELSARGQVAPAPPHEVDAGFSWSLRLPDGARARGAGRLEGTLASLRVTHELTRPFSADLSGTVSPLDDPPALDLVLKWRSLKWPLAGTPEFSSDSGTLEARGDLRDLHLSLDAGLGGALPVRRIRADAGLKRPGEALDARLEWHAALADGSEASGAGTASGDLDRLRIDHALEQPLRFTTRGEVVALSNTPRVALEGGWQDLAWPLAGEPSLVSDAGRYRIHGPLDALAFRLGGGLRSKSAGIHRMNVELEGEASAAAPFPFEARLSFDAGLNESVRGTGRATFQGDARRVAFDARVDGPAVVETRGAVTLTGAKPEIELSGEWRGLRWPLAGEARFESAAGRFSAMGPVDGLDVQVRGDASGRGLPAADARLRARVTPAGARIGALVVKTLDGNIRAGGEVAWQPQPRWDLTVTASGLNPGRYAGGWPGEIALESSIRGRLENGRPKLELRRLAIDGRLRGHPVSARGSLGVDGGQITAKSLVIQSGDNRLSLEGVAGQRLDLALTIDAPALEAVAPGLQGTIEGKARLDGSRDRPRLSARVSGSDLAFGAHGARSLDVNVEARGGTGERSRIGVEAGGLYSGDTPLGRLSLSGEGTPGDHRLALDLTAESATLGVTAAGVYRDARWSGTLKSTLRTADFGDWSTPSAAALAAGAGAVDLEDLCLVQNDGRVCVRGSWRRDEDSLSARGEITALPVSLAQPLLPRGLSAEGELNGEFDVGGSPAEPRVSAFIRADSGGFELDPGEGFESTRFSYRDGRLEAAYADNETRLETALDVDGAGSLRGRVAIGAFGGSAPPRLDGRLEADFSDLSFVSVIVPRLTDARGRLDAGIDIAGSVESPAVTGKLALEDAAVNVPDLGLELRDMKLELASRQPGRARIDGALTSGGGRLKLAGEAGWSPQERRVALDVSGREVEVARLPTVNAYVSPDLRLQADAESARLTGRVHVPRARVMLKELPRTAVRVSEDEIIVGAEQTGEAVTPRAGPAMRVDVDVSLGDEVHFEGFGLSTGVEGSLTFSGESGQAPRTQGTLSLRKGRYEAYGQDLRIQTGRLLFAGPVDNPGIDLTAVRELEEVTAGIVVSGNVKSIRSRVFSEPPLPEADAFSYLLTGRPLAGGSETDAATLQKAAAALGLNRAQMITEQIGNMLGLDEVSVGGDGVDQTSLLLGKQITPDIFIRYALGVFEQSGKLLLNYRLTDSVSVQAESGEQQGMDIIYRIEREKLFGK